MYTLIVLANVKMDHNPSSNNNQKNAFPRNHTSIHNLYYTAILKYFDEILS